MTRIIVDETLRNKLHNLTEALELYDDAGRLLARVIPFLDASKYNLEPQISAEEIQRRRQSNEKTYTTAELLAHLEKL